MTNFVVLLTAIVCFPLFKERKQTYENIILCISIEILAQFDRFSKNLVMYIMLLDSISYTH